MWTRQHKKRKSGALIVPAIAAVFLSYFGYHTFQGEFGIYSRQVLDARVDNLTAELEAVREKRMQMEHRVKLLRDGSLEKDMLDEYARRELNLARDDEVVIFRPRNR